VILAGDFNSEPDSPGPPPPSGKSNRTLVRPCPVYASVIQQRYVDAWLQCNHNPQAPAALLPNLPYNIQFVTNYYKY